MIKLNILPLLEKKGKTKYWLYKQLGMSWQNFSRMVNNQTSSIKLERIEALCQLLECTPNDLFLIDWDHEKPKTRSPCSRMPFSWKHPAAGGSGCLSQTKNPGQLKSETVYTSWDKPRNYHCPRHSQT